MRTLLQPSDRFGRYIIREWLGAGGLSDVYRACDPQLARDVAIKILADDRALDPQHLARFAREAQVLASLNHPNIAGLIGVERAGDRQALVMELVDGDTLAERLAERLTVREALEIAVQVAGALEAAHERGIVHRDLKPANIQIRRDGVVKVLDFGLAKSLPSSDGSTGVATPTVTLTGPLSPVLGTAAYMSPEQARGAALDRRTDVWSFGCVLYEMLAGRRPFEGATASDTIANVLGRDPDLTALPAQTPAAVVRVVRRCLQKDVRDRLKDMGDARLDIEDVLAAGESAQPAVPVPAASRRWWPLVTFASGAGAVLAIGLLWNLQRPLPAGAARMVRIVMATNERPITRVSSRSVAMMPDGSAFTYRSVQGLVVHFLDGRPDVVVGDDDARDPFFSPDRQWIGYSSGDVLAKMSLSGGPPSTLTVTGPGAAGTWGPDGIVYTASDGLRRVAVQGGPPEPLPMATLAPNEQATFPEMLPGGRTVLVTILPFRSYLPRTVPAETPQARIDAVDLRTGERKTILRNAGAARFTPSGHLIYVTQRRLRVVAFDPARLETQGEPVDAVPGTGTYDFAVSADGSLVYTEGGDSTAESLPVWIDRNGRQEPLGAPIAPYAYPELSPDGTRVAFVARNRERGDRDIWVWDLVRRVMTQPFAEPGDASTVAWSPDGLRLAFGSAPDDGVINTYWQHADGRGPVERVMRSEQVQMPLVFARDGRLLISADVPGESRNIIAAPLDGSGRSESLLTGPATELAADISPDGRWLAYDSNESGQFEVYVRPYPDIEGGRWTISRGGGRQPVWSPDGRELFYRDFSGAVMSAAVTSTGGFRAGLPTRILDGAGFRGGGPMGSAQTYAVARDGRFLMLKFTEAAEPSLVLVLNWADEVRRLLSR